MTSTSTSSRTDEIGKESIFVVDRSYLFGHILTSYAPS